VAHATARRDLQQPGQSRVELVTRERLLKEHRVPERVQHVTFVRGERRSTDENDRRHDAPPLANFLKQPEAAVHRQQLVRDDDVGPLLFCGDQRTGCRLSRRHAIARELQPTRD
jgi:hypothetical protein